MQTEYTRFPNACPTLGRISIRIRWTEYLNEAINPCGSKGEISSKPTHSRPEAGSSLDRTGSNYLAVNLSSRRRDYELWERRTAKHSQRHLLHLFLQRSAQWQISSHVARLYINLVHHRLFMIKTLFKVFDVLLKVTLILSTVSAEKKRKIHRIWNAGSNMC